MNRSCRIVFQIYFAALLTVFTPLSVAKSESEIIGAVTAKRADTVKVEFKPHKTAGVNRGDLVDFKVVIEGLDVNAGKGEVIESGSNFAWVRVSKGRPNLKTIGIIQATGSPVQPASAQGEGIQPRHRCDELAANPVDTQHVGPGVKFNSIVIEPAVSACEDAVKQHPRTSRFHYQLGRAYYADGQYQKAMQGYRQAADRGYAIAQHNVGYLYWMGKGVSADNVEALKWFRLAAAQGLAASEFRLGYMYNNGEGVTKDGVEALKFYRKAAEQGWIQAQRHLGYVYDRGIGVAQDRVEAKKWYTKAAAQGDESAKIELRYFD